MKDATSTEVEHTRRQPESYSSTGATVYWLKRFDHRAYLCLCPAMAPERSYGPLRKVNGPSRCDLRPWVAKIFEPAKPLL